MPSIEETPGGNFLFISNESIYGPFHSINMTLALAPGMSTAKIQALMGPTMTGQILDRASPKAPGAAARAGSSTCCGFGHVGKARLPPGPMTPDSPRSGASTGHWYAVAFSRARTVRQSRRYDDRGILPSVSSRRRLTAIRRMSTKLRETSRRSMVFNSPQGTGRRHAG